MLKNPPFIGNFPLLRPFGAPVGPTPSPGYKGVMARGHNGIDFALPPLTPILAVDAGTVVAIHDDPSGYGIYLVLRHQWGQSLYAHLHQVKVRLGDAVSAGMEIALSGATGAATASHLHFGIRIIPFSVVDGWCGYSDPAPYLSHLNKIKGPNVGPHIIGGITPHLPLLKTWQPRLITVLDPNPDEIRLLRQACPESHIVARLYIPESEIESRVRHDPVAAARWAHDNLMERMTPDVNYWQFTNELLQSPATLPLLNKFELARMALADAHGYRCAILAFSVGNPDLPRHDPMSVWRLIYPALEHAETHGHVAAVHQYGMPDLWGPENGADWYIHRLEHQVLRHLPFKQLKFAVTEFGIDGLIRGNSPAGWQAFTDAAGYVEQITRASHYLERFSGRVLGYSIFTLGHHAPWGAYDINGAVANQLAETLPRGLLSASNTTVPELTPEVTDILTAPGPYVLPPSPSLPDGATPTTSPAFTRRLAPHFEKFNMRIRSLEERPDQQADDIVYIIKDVFMTFNGSWHVVAGADSVPEWARADYLQDNFTEAGADHHLLAALIGLDGKLVTNHEIIFWSDGFERLADPAYSGYIRANTRSDSGWANLFMVASSSFAPERGESGPWCWAPAGAAEVITGGGLPLNHAVSTFVVWQAMPYQDWLALTNPNEENEEENEDNNAGDNEGDNEEDSTENPSQPNGKMPEVERRISDWALYYNLQIKSLHDLPDPVTGEVVYLVKDIFTTRNGSWEVDELPGSLPEWAREAYLKPMNAPDFFDDAGGDHHLFAAVIGLDGQLLRSKEILFWSDGFETLADPEYRAYVRRTTKERSGWANIITGPGSSFVPERGESGPWCWAPEGSAEVVCGGGLPANHHISMFVVWQQVKRKSSDDDNNESTDFDESIYLPSIINNSQPPGSPPAAAHPLLNPATALALHHAAWAHIGVEYPSDPTLLEFARRRGLGAPLTAEFKVGNYRAQGFQFGLVYLHNQHPQSPASLPW